MNEFDRETTQEETPGLSRIEASRLWRFAGTAVALIFLLAMAVYFWAALSDLSPAIAPGREVVTAATRTAVTGLPPFAEPKVVSSGSTNVFFGEHIQLVGYALEEVDGWLKVRLHWSPQVNWAETTRVWVRVQGEDGETLKSHNFQPEGDREDSVVFEPIYGWEAPENGRCLVIISLYNEVGSNEALPITADPASVVSDGGRPAVKLADWECRYETTPVAINLADEAEHGLVQAMNITANDSLHLLSYERMVIGGEVGIALTWKVIKQPETDYSYSFYLWGGWATLESGAPLVALPVMDPLLPQANGARPISEWKEGEVVTQYYVLRLPPELPTPYTLEDGAHWIMAYLLYSHGVNSYEIPMLLDGVQIKGGQMIASPAHWQFGSGTVSSMPAEHLAEITLYAELNLSHPEGAPFHLQNPLSLQLESQGGVTLYGARTYIGLYTSLEVTNAQTGETIADGWVYVPDYNTILRFGAQVDPEVSDERYASDVKITAVRPTPDTHLVINEPIPFNIEIAPGNMGFSLRDGMVYLDIILAAPINGRMHWITSDTYRGGMSSGSMNLIVTPAQLARLPQEAGELVLILQLREPGKSRPYFVSQPEQYRWSYER